MAGQRWPILAHGSYPRDFPNTRVMSFGYDADVTKFIGPVSRNTVRDHAENLLNDLTDNRGTDGTETHPIILVVHSLGGLLAKKALLLSEQAAELHERQLHECTIGVAFFGTPHRGSGVASFATAVAHILKAAQKRVNTSILALLKRDSEALADIDSSFGLWLRKKGDQIQIACFSEEHELPGIGMDMVRFSDAEDIGYRRTRVCCSGGYVKSSQVESTLKVVCAPCPSRRWIPDVLR
ncbi:hypothetical protein QBC40DRAFT_350343 [Triangularia verruculosa]|uniref:GPI inositol-deacylase n=1 Tax=Triangularia verruculosa TaxID=2587418 RepID=A0AAN6XCI5_9PEZI|nr:hypothetical protein QBC40DRAFT_350343 [Triangularia verruculosa]